VIGKGLNLTSTATGNLVPLASDTSKGNTRTPVVRPTSGAWDAGAYQFVGGSSLNPCDMNSSGATDISDVQLCANQAIGAVACSSGDINHDSACNVVDVQRVVNNALGGQCVTQ